MSTPLFVPRRLAIALLAAAQKQEGPVSGLIGARDGEPASVHAGDGAQLPAGETLWAVFRTDGAPAGAAAPRELLLSVDLKGVLQLHCREGGVERELKIRE